MILLPFTEIAGAVFRSRYLPLSPYSPANSIDFVRHLH